MSIVGSTWSTNDSCVSSSASTKPTREIRAQTWKLMTLMVAVVGVVVAAVRL